MNDDVGSPLVTVIIPCYGQAHYLGEAIESVLAQTYPHCEVIVIDDGSTDNTKEVAAAYDGVRYIYQENQGLAGARNAGIRESRGAYLVFLDADDRLLPDALANGVEQISAHPEYAFVSGHHRYIRADGSFRNEHPPEWIEADAYRAMLQINCIGMHAAVMYRRRIFDIVGQFDTSLTSCEDYDLYLRITRDHRVHHYDRVVAEYRQHDANMSFDTGRMLRTALVALGAQRRYVSGNPSYLSAYRLGIRAWRKYYTRKLARQISMSVKARRWSVIPRLSLRLAAYPGPWFAAVMMEARAAVSLTLANRVLSANRPTASGDGNGR